MTKRKTTKQLIVEEQIKNINVKLTRIAEEIRALQVQRSVLLEMIKELDAQLAAP